MKRRVAALGAVGSAAVAIALIAVWGTQRRAEVEEFEPARPVAMPLQVPSSPDSDSMGADGADRGEASPPVPAETPPPDSSPTESTPASAPFPQVSRFPGMNPEAQPVVALEEVKKVRAYAAEAPISMTDFAAELKRTGKEWPWP